VSMQVRIKLFGHLCGPPYTTVIVSRFSFGLKIITMFVLQHRGFRFFSFYARSHRKATVIVSTCPSTWTIPSFTGQMYVQLYMADV
jgi:hypothetical protein